MNETAPDAKDDAVNTPAPATQAPAAPAAHPTNGLAIASLVTGVLALLTGFIFIGFALGVAAIILGAIGLRKQGGKGMSIAGIVTGALGLFTSLVIGAIALFAIVTGGAVLNEASNQLNDYNREQQSLLDAKKNFLRGETGIFANLEVNIRGVERNYVPENEFFGAEEGNELVVVDLAVKNKDSDQESVSSYDFSIVVDGVATSPAFADAEPSFEGGALNKDATASGKIVFEVPAGATGLKLQYSTYAGLEPAIYTIEL